MCENRAIWRDPAGGRYWVWVGELTPFIHGTRTAGGENGRHADTAVLQNTRTKSFAYCKRL